MGNIAIGNTTWKRAIYPNNPPCLDADRNFISESWAIELMRSPNWVKWCLFECAKVHPINHDFADTSIIIHEPTIPINLYQQT